MKNRESLIFESEVKAIEALVLEGYGVEIGVGLTVMAIMYSLYLDLASHGHLDEGL